MAVTAEKTKAEEINENPLAKFDGSVLKAIAVQDLESSPAAFLPATMAEAMELGKLMAASNFVPPHLRQRAGDCLAIVMQSTRWEMDPFAVANKSYFVNDRMAFEAQLIVAVINTRAPLVGRLKYEFSGEGPTLHCRVSCKIKGDPETKTAEQSIATITTRNSPLWKQSPEQQLGYYTARLWARRHCPEVLLGVYAPDEIEEMKLERQQDGTYAAKSVPPRPQRGDFTGGTAADQEGGAEDKGDSSTGATVTHEREGLDLIDHVGEVKEAGLDAPNFGMAIHNLFQAATSLKDLRQIEENNRQSIAGLPDALRLDLVNSYDQAAQKFPNERPKSQQGQQTRKLV